MTNPATTETITRQAAIEKAARQADDTESELLAAAPDTGPDTGPDIYEIEEQARRRWAGYLNLLRR